MGIDLATIIAAMGVIGTGNPLALKPGFSIGGMDPKSKNLLGNLLGLLGKNYTTHLYRTASANLTTRL